MSYNLFLDDIRKPEHVGNYITPISLRPLYRLGLWQIVKDYDQFVSIIQTQGLPFLISFDHDLADVHYGVSQEPESWEEYHLDEYREKTGYDCAKWLVDYCIDNKLILPEFIVHSMNFVGLTNIESLLNNFKKQQNK